ncbi:MAG TPA: hypothetical protein VGM90_21315 [Kofleriaceae bacterium]
MRWGLLCLCLLGCGRIAFTPVGEGQGGDDAEAPDASSPACVAFGPWGPPVHDPNLSSVGIDWGPSLSHDELTIVFASDRNNVGGGEDLYLATRPTPTSAWSTSTRISEIVPGIEPEDPSLSADGLDIYWGNPAVSTAHRPNIAASFSVVGEVLSDTAAVNVLGGPDISPDGLTLLFTGSTSSDGNVHMFEAHRSAIGDAWGPFEMPLGLAQAQGEQYGSYRGDLLEVMFNNPKGGQLDLFAATRASPTSAFGPATEVTELDTGNNEGDADLSDDGATLVFASDRAPSLGSWDIWVSTRTCL